MYTQRLHVFDDGVCRDNFDALDRPFRRIFFQDSPAVVLVAALLRHAWTVLPPTEEPDDEAIVSFMKAYNALTEEERMQIPQNRDKDSLHTLWRDAVYHQWNRVFNHMGNYLLNIHPGIGHFHPPIHGVCALEHPVSSSRDGDRGPVVAKKLSWGTNVLLILAHQEPDVSLRVTISPKNENMTEERIEETLDASSTAKIWFLKRGVEVCFHVEGDYDREECEGLAAVLAIGILCTGSHVEDGALEARRRQSEVDSAVANVVNI